jgi:hypothetical protein
MFIWYLAIRYRRHWIGYACVTGGALLLILISRPAVGENALAALLPSGFRSGYRQMMALLIPESVLIALVGYFIVSIPHRHGPTQCRRCGYDLQGLSPRGLSCPECGAEWRGKGSGLEEPPIVLTPIVKGPPRKRAGL